MQSNNNWIDPDFETHLIRECVGKAEIRHLKSGINSAIYLVDDGSNKYVLKRYKENRLGANGRLNREYHFLYQLNKHNILCVPKPIAIDQTSNAALYSYLDGEHIGLPAVSDIKQAAEFIEKLERVSISVLLGEFENAAESCFSILEHLDCVESRIRLLAASKGPIPYRQDVKEFACQDLGTAFDTERRKLMREYVGLTTVRLDRSLRILSPSDFGFRNILKQSNTLYFLDFEYAGWDDPAKLICDFIVRPDHNLSQGDKQLFVQKLAVFLPDDEVVHRARTLERLYQIKWCCILLNSFLDGYKVSSQECYNDEKLWKKVNKAADLLKKGIVSG